MIRARRADGDRAVVIHNGTDCERFSPLTPEERRRSEQSGIPQSGLLVAGAGAPVRGEGLETLIGAVARLPRQGEREVYWLIAGDGPMRKLLQEAHRPPWSIRALASSRISPRRTFDLGGRRRRRAALTSRGIPTLLCEAMAMARPVVATRVGGIPELVEDGRSGLVVEPREPQALADALGALLADPHARERLGGHGRQRIVSEFSLERMVNETDRVLQTVLADRALTQSNGRGATGRR